MTNNPEEHSLAADIAEGLLGPGVDIDRWPAIDDAYIATRALILAEKLRRTGRDPGDTFLHGIALGIAFKVSLAEAEKTLKDIQGLNDSEATT